MVTEFVIQHKIAEGIVEALYILKKWNPKWCPKFFMSDYSEAEMAALEQAFPNTTQYLCDFLSFLARLNSRSHTIYCCDLCTLGFSMQLCVTL